MTHTHHVRRWTALVAVLATALATAAGTLSGAVTSPAAADHTPLPSTVTLVGSLQSELGCSDDWQPACTATRLARVGDTTAYAGTFQVPQGTWQLKVALNGGWDESYGADGGGNIPLVLQGPASVRFSYDHATHKVGVAPTDLPGGVSAADKALAQPSLRAPLTREQMYFVMADRFANGSTANDTGGLTGGRMETGLDPTDKGFYHGGDLAGLTQKLDYIKGLGTTAIWLTPSFKNRPVQGTGSDASAGYHGYWITDFTQIDPHLGTNADMKRLIAAAHAKGMKVFFDIITNHTADVIDYAGGQHGYVDEASRPYRYADGTEFKAHDLVGKSSTPALDPATSFPYQPVFRTEADRTVKVPAWLNDPTRYHNRGDSTFAGESAEYGDFVGLDDLFTEQPEVVKGMTDVYKTWVDFGIDGFRIDTVKHVDMEFWQQFSPAIMAHAKALGRKDFFMFGEVYDADPRFMSRYTTTGRLPATLDFGFQSNALAFAQGKPTASLRDFFAADDYYTDTDSNAYELPTFLGNHDMGRVGMMLRNGGASGSDLLRRDTLAHQLMYLTRGQPVVYYGDEQGFTGAGGDKDARQDMFPTQVDTYAKDAVVGSDQPAGTGAHYDTTAPLYRSISALGRLRAAHPALADGAQIPRYASGSAGIYAVSRIDRSEKVEYLVVANNATDTKQASFPTYGDRTTYQPLYGATDALRSDSEGRVTVSVPPLSVAVYRATRPVDARPAAPAVYFASPGAGGVVSGRAEIRVAVPENAFSQVTFAYRPVGTKDWQRLGTDDNAPYRVFHDTSGLAKGTLVEYRAVLEDSSGNYSAASTYGVVGDPAPAGGAGAGVGSVTQPDNVSVPGSANSEMGCPGDWQPDCPQAQLSLDPKDDIWKGTYSSIPAGDYEYKAAIDKSWTENYGLGGKQNGSNIPVHVSGTGPVSFYYDHRTHYAQSDAQGPIITAPGSFQSEMGCPGDWAPDCMRSWLQDPDGDGTYTLSTTQIPAGSYETKVAHGLSWTENYGAGGAAGGSNISFTVPADGVVTTFSYKLSTHVLTVSTSKAGAAPDLAKAKAIWVQRGLVAWPADGVPAGTDPRTLRWRLHWSPDASLAVDEEAVTGGSSAALTYDPAGLPSDVVAAHPELKGYLALRLSPTTQRQVPDILRGQVAVGMYDDLGHLLDATGVQVPYVLDDVYAGARDRALGLTWAGRTPSLALWAPTAQAASLLVWPAGATGGAPQRVALRRDGDGVWQTTGLPRWKDAEYLYEVKVFAPTTRKVETNLVTDPYSLALTQNSTRSVAVDQADPALAPAQWRTTPSPRLAQAVDSTIYELHVRDFSIGDPTVPAAHRGTYLAFADQGDGTKHLRALAKAGLNTVHLLPTFDIATIQEDRAKQAQPPCQLSSYPPDSDQQQACVTKVAATDGYNWGYDPLHYMAPEGSYATDADGGARVAEFRTMVGGLHSDGLRVVLDQVFNHTAASGQAPTSVLDRVVPGYYQRLDRTGSVYTSTCCQDVATEHAMAQKLMVDAVVTWAKDYKVDGFRFDLMGHHSRDTMLAVRHALDALTLQHDGVDGRSIYLYGEGWNFGEVANNALFTQATQGQLGGTGIGTFSDRLRDAVRGGGPFDDDPRKQGLGSGLAGAPNGAAVNGDAAAQAKELAHDTDLTELGMAGNLRAFTFRSAATGQQVRGDQVDYNGSPAGYADQPDEVVSYVDAHDNETLWDSLTYKLAPATTMADRVRMNTVSLATTALAQTPSFWHAGADLLRSKSLDRNSYDSGDWFNTLDWTGVDNGFGHGLPPKADNGSKWSFQQPLLADRSLKPTAQDVATATAAAQDLLRLRFSTPLFRLGSAQAIEQKLSFPVSGTPDAHPGVLVMRIDDTVGADVDPALRGALVVLNASAEPVTQRIPGLAGQRLSLSPVQAGGSDPVVRTTTWDPASGTASVPARTVAVLLQH